MWVADISKARGLYGWEPKHTLEEGLRLTIDWQRRRLAADAGRECGAEQR
jgi:nucleoside-diphosphate-sugar epimerase